jgi:membrane-anchored protein YejM (alkaline phosphatase superfamily)
MVLNIITSPASLDSLHVNYSMKISAMFIVVFLIFLEFVLYKVVESNFANKLASIFNKRFFIAIFLIILSEKFTFGISDLLSKEKILQSAKIIPLYQPLTFSKLADKFGIKKQKNDNNIKALNTTSNLNYPHNKIEIDESKKRVDIFIILLDALRASSIDKETTPNIVEFSKDSIIFKNHISGGDATRFGMFSLFYGLNSTYWFNFLPAKREPLFFEVLKKRDYNIKIFSSTDTRWPEFKETIYSGITDNIVDNKSGTPAQKDRAITKSFVEFIKAQDSKKPIFSLIFLDAPHGYSYPKDFSKFKPNAGNDGIDYLDINPKNITKIKNSYKNAVLFDDSLFKNIIDAIKSSKRYKDSIIILSSDHGEEFYEYGSFGHNSSFSKAQINSPFIIKLPDSSHKIITKTTSHLDVVPTLLNILGVKNPPNDYSNGYNLFDNNYSREFCYVAKWNKNAIVTDEFTYIFSNYPNEIFKSEIRDTKSYKKVPKNRAKRVDDILIKVLEQNREFLK